MPLLIMCIVEKDFGHLNLVLVWQNLKLSIAFQFYLAGTRMIMSADVVDTDVPLLFSKTFMKNNGFVIDLVNDIAIVHGKKVSLNSTSSGHYCLPI